MPVTEETEEKTNKKTFSFWNKYFLDSSDGAQGFSGG